jgi:AraC-like DNA-binding protein
LASTDIIRYSFKAELPQEFEIVNLQLLYKYHQSKLTEMHRTGFYQVFWITAGSSSHLVDFNEVQLTAGTLLFINKDVVQRFDNRDEYDGWAILFTDSFFCKTAAHTRFLQSISLFNNLLSHPITVFPEAHSLLALMQAELQSKADGFQEEIVRNLLFNFLMLAEREGQTTATVKQSADLDYLALFRDLLELHFHELRQVSNYAEKLHVTEKRLNKATAAILGKSPKQLIDERVNLEAKRLLAYTTDTVKEIGFTLGFDEPTNFIKYFRKHNGVTPIEFREQIDHSL